jgi:putative transposase
MTSWRPAGSLRILTIVDIFSRFSPAVEPRFSFSGDNVVKCWKE